MALIKELKGSFVGGKVSKPLQNRTDLEKFNTWLTEAKNTQIKPEGSISNRAGTIYVGECKDPSYRLTINVNVSATIIINGVTYSGASVYVDLPTGSASYEYEVSAEGYDTKSGSGTITEDTVITVTLETDANDYTFEITPTPVDATVTINGTEQSSITAPAGTLIEWEVSKTGYVTQSGSFLLSSDTESPMVVTLEAVKYKIYYFYYDNDSQSLKLDLFKEVDSYNFKDGCSDYGSKVFVADGCVYQVQDYTGSFVKLVDGGCSSCSYSFYVKNGVIYNRTTASYNDTYTWSRVGFCIDIDKLYALTTDGKLYAITISETEVDLSIVRDLTSTVTLISEDVVDFKCSLNGCIYYTLVDGSKNYIKFHNGTSNTQLLYSSSQIDIQLVSALQQTPMYVANGNLYVGTSIKATGVTRASGFYNSTTSIGYYYYIKDGQLYFKQKTQADQLVDAGTVWNEVSINATAQYFTRYIGSDTLAICNNDLYFIDQYHDTGGNTPFILDTPTLINSTENFIEVYTLQNYEKTTKNRPIMFAIARDL